MRIFESQWLAILYVFLVAGCAQVGSPTGGPKDETPPSLLEAIPEVGATGVRPDRLILEFDEYVKAGQWRSQMLVSPPLDASIDLIVRGRKVEVSWAGQLRDSSTYVFQFGEGIVDVNEGNPAKHLVHAFSTGDRLDTLVIQGVVNDAIDENPSADLRVMLYPEAMSLDSVLAGVAPQFVGATDDQGAFEVGYLPRGGYRVMAVEDANRNYAWDEGERVALGPKNAMAGDTSVLVLRSGETEGPRAPYLSEARRDSTGHASWTLSETLQEGDSLSWLEACDLTLLTANKNLIQAWGWEKKMDSVAMHLVWHHAPTWPAGEWTTDTLDVPAPRWTSKEEMVLTEKPLGKRLPGEAPKLSWSAPLSSVDTSLFLLKVDSSLVSAAVEGPWPSLDMVFADRGLVKPGVHVSLTIYPGALNRAGAESEVLPADTLDLMWSVQPKDALSTWILNVQGAQCAGLVELTDGQGMRLDVVPVYGDTVLTWTGMAPGRVGATWWGDLDANQVWRNVDVGAWLSPEPIFKLAPVELRSNWVLESTWNLDASACGGVLEPMEARKP